MIRFPTNQLVLEGPDCSGKTSLYYEIHKASGFQWNIQDRSWLSMLVYGILYGRDTKRLSRGLWEELTCLNNRIVLSLPGWETVKVRFEKRGDDFQDLSSLERLYNLFEDHHDWLIRLPNVTHLNNATMTKKESGRWVADIISAKENITIDDLSQQVSQFVSNVPYAKSFKDCEASLNFTFYDTVALSGFTSEYDPDRAQELLLDATEGAYYTEIREKFLGKIRDEIEGRNEYNEKQKASSRRFVYTDERCISFIQALVRNDILDFHVVCRSTDCTHILSRDLNFLHSLANDVLKCNVLFKDISDVRFRIHLNAAHLVR